MQGKQSSYKCPVCGCFQIVEYEDCIEGNMCEYEESCPNGCMEYLFAYGAFEERVGDKKWVWFYTETLEQADKRHQERNVQITKMKNDIESAKCSL